MKTVEEVFNFLDELYFEHGIMPDPYIDYTDCVNIHTGLQAFELQLGLTLNVKMKQANDFCQKEGFDIDMMCLQYSVYQFSEYSTDMLIENRHLYLDFVARTGLPINHRQLN
jgi:hypothetical protein